MQRLTEAHKFGAFAAVLAPWIYHDYYNGENAVNQGFCNALQYMVRGLLLVMLVSTSMLAIKNHLTRRMLRFRGLPTIQWRPHFVNYSFIPLKGRTNMCPTTHGGGVCHARRQSILDLVNALVERHDRKPLSSSNITNILPRMERLKGPFGMYGTVYGISTAVEVLELKGFHRALPICRLPIDTGNCLRS